MPPLKNTTREMFAREIIKQNGHITNAYKKIYKPTSTKEINIQSTASHLFARQDIKDRISELLNSTGLSIAELNKKLQGLVNHKKPLVVDGNVEYFDDGNVQLSATTLAYKLHGVLSNSEVDNSIKIQSNSVTQINNIDSFNVSLQSISTLTSKLSHKNKLSGKINVNKDDNSSQVIDIK